MKYCVSIDLIEQRLEQVIVVLVDYRDVERLATQCFCGGEAAESGSDDDDARGSCHDFACWDVVCPTIDMGSLMFIRILPMRRPALKYRLPMDSIARAYRYATSRGARTGTRE